MMKLGIAAALSLSVVLAQDKPASKDVPPKAAASPITLPTNATRDVIRPGARFERSGAEITAEQRGKLEEINKSYTAAATPLYARLNTARKELEMAVNQEKTDEATIRARVKDIADAETDLALARARRYTQLREFLSPEQARRFNTAIPINRPFQGVAREGQPPPPISPAK